jgi:hypothetical protein
MIWGAEHAKISRKEGKRFKWQKCFVKKKIMFCWIISQ